MSFAALAARSYLHHRHPESTARGILFVGRGELLNGWFISLRIGHDGLGKLGQWLTGRFVLLDRVGISKL